MAGSHFYVTFNPSSPKTMFEIFKSEKSGEFYFRFKVKSGQVILSSEGYLGQGL